MAKKRKPLGPLLWDRPETKYIWFRMAVPKRYWHVAGTKKIQESLETENLSEARRRRDNRRDELIAHWRSLAGDPCDSNLPEAQTSMPRVRFKPTEAELEEAAVAVGIDIALTDAADRRRNLLSFGDWAYELAIDEAKQRHADQSRENAMGSHQLAASHADLVIEALGFDLTRGGPEYRHLCDLINQALFVATQVDKRRALGDLEAEPESALLRRVRARESRTAKPGERIMELFELWAEDRQREGKKRLDTITQDRKALTRFVDFVGADRAVDSISAAEVAEFRDTLKKLPPKWMSKRELRDLTMREAAAKARELGMPRTALTTVNKYLSTISPLFSWLAEQPRWAGLANPCNGLLAKGVKGRNRRPSFSTPLLNTILRSPLFVGFQRDGREHVPGNVQANDWRRWIPLICMFTGARIGEVAQLRIGDIRNQSDIWLFWIRHDASQGVTTKNGKDRFVPLHSLLRRMGFMKFFAQRMDAMGGDADARLFPELVPNERGFIGGDPSEWWRDYLTAIGVKTGADGLGAHSFRHTISDRLRTEAEILDEQIAVCLGHQQKTTTGGYGSIPQGTARMMSEWMEGVTFDGVDFSHLIV